MATLGNLIDCNNDNNPFRRQLMRQQRRRQLRFTGRGSTSIIGLSSNPSVDSRIKTDDDDDDGSICQFKEGAVGGEMMNEVEKFMEGISPDFSGSVVIMEEERDEDKVNSDNNNGGGGEVLAETRVDGVIDPASVVRSALPPQQNHHQQQPAASSSIEEESGSAYNYLSTKSEILEFEPTWTQPDAVVVAPNNRSSSSSSSSVTTFTPPKLRSGGGGAGRRTKCNIIQGQMTLFVSNTADLTYENLDARILNAIRSDLNDELILQQEFLNDENVVGLRLLEPAALTMDDGTLSSSSPVTVAATSSSAPSNTNNNDSGGFTSSYVSIGVISGLGVIFLILIGLFAYTSRPKKRRRLNIIAYDNDDDQYEDELQAVSALFNGKKSAAGYWGQGPPRVGDSSRREMVETPIPRGVEASFSREGVVIKSDSVTDEESVHNNMDDFFFNNRVEESKPRKVKPFGRLFGRNKRNAPDSDDVFIDDDNIVIEPIIEQEGESPWTEIQADDFGFETKRTDPLRPMSAYTSPTALNSRPRPPKVYCAAADRGAIQTCHSGALSSCFPAPEIGNEEESYISALTDVDQYGRHTCAQTDGEQFRRATKGAIMTQCGVAPDDISVPTSVATNQLALRQANGNAVDGFADCWNPFEGNFWQGWFE